MKKILLASILGLGISIPALSFGQGVIMFGNYTARPGYDTPVIWGYEHPGGVQEGDPVDDPGAIIGLWAGQGVVTDSTALTIIATTPLFKTVESGPGWYDMSVSGVGLGSANIPASMWTGTQTLTFQIRGVTSYKYFYWSAHTDLWQEYPDTAGGSIDVITPNQMVNGPKQLVFGAPEPTSFALAAVGLALVRLFPPRNRHSD